MLAKDPADRPATAGALASAVDAIRRDDLDAAVAAVPGMRPFLDGEAPAPARRSGSSAAPGGSASGAAAARGGSGPVGDSTASFDAVAPLTPAPVGPDRTGNPAAPPADAGSSRTGGSGAQRRGSAPILIGLVVVLALAVIGLLAALLLRDGGDSQTPEGTVSTASASSSALEGATTVEVVAEDLIGQDVDDVVAELTGSGLNVEQVAQASSTRPADEVIAVSPAGTLSPGDTVTVTHSSGPEMATLPDDLTGRPAQEAAGDITELGVNVDVYYEQTDAQDDGDVVRADPGEGQEVEVGSSVALYVAGSSADQAASPATQTARTSAASPTTASEQGYGSDASDSDTEQNAETSADAAPGARAEQSLPAEG